MESNCETTKTPGIHLENPMRRQLIQRVWVLSKRAKASQTQVVVVLALEKELHDNVSEKKSLFTTLRWSFTTSVFKSFEPRTWGKQQVCRDR